MLAKFQVLNSFMYLVATVLDNSVLILSHFNVLLLDNFSGYFWFLWHTEVRMQIFLLALYQY